MISDLDLTLRLSQICKLSYCPHTLSKWRIHSSSDSEKKRSFFFRKIASYRKFKDRKFKFRLQKIFAL